MRLNPALVAGSGSTDHQTPPSGGASIHFYHLTTTPLERALPKLLEKAYGSGARTMLLADEERVDALNELLWTYDPNSFLPHGSEKDGNAEKQPILILSSPPRLRGGRGGHTPAYHGKIGEGEFTSRDPKALEHAKTLRKNATDAENKLWYFLQKDNLGVSFRKQHPVGKYIADFACIAKSLIIEIDGGQHAERVEQDNERTAFLEAAGFKVLRFWNNEILENMDGVLQVIVGALGESDTVHPPSPPASGGVKNEILCITNGHFVEETLGYSRILDIFDGSSDEKLAAARARWKAYKEAGHELIYYQQTNTGGWDKKAA